MKRRTIYLSSTVPLKEGDFWH